LNVLGLNTSTTAWVLASEILTTMGCLIPSLVEIWFPADCNRDSVKMFEQTAPQNFSVLKILSDDVYAEIVFTNEKKRKQEFHFGSSYLSQSSREVVLTPGVKVVRIVNMKGQTRKFTLN
jgi:hypothetical protein